MKRLTTLLTISALSLGLSACTGDDSGDGMAADTSGTGTTSGADGMPNPTTMTTSPNPTTVGADSGSDGMMTGTEGTTGMMATTGADPGFVFNDTAPRDLTLVDRSGMPAINTAVISSKDEYNVASPVDDANGDFVPEIVASLEFLHGALDDDLLGAGLAPCAVDDCVAQAAPLVVPDVIRIDPALPAGFPNGRLPADPVIDVTLAVILLDLADPGQDALTLAGLPLNPPENDVPFLADFPFLAEPH